jgi:hypothetical protein
LLHPLAGLSGKGIVPVNLPFQGGIMATIVIKDLSDNTELDRQAMLAIAGGSRLRAGGRFVRPVSPRIRLFDPARIAAARADSDKPSPR